MYKLEELQKMSVDQLVLLVSQLQQQLDEEPKKKSSRAGVVNVGSPKIVKDYVDFMKRKLEQERGGKTG